MTLKGLVTSDGKWTMTLLAESNDGKLTHRCETEIAQKKHVSSDTALCFFIMLLQMCSC